MTEAEGYADSLRLQAEWLDGEFDHLPGVCNLLDAADFIMHQQAVIDALIHVVEREPAIVMAELSYDANYLHHGGG